MKVRALVRRSAGAVLRKALALPVVPSVPEGRMVELPGRGSTFVVDVPGPPGAPTLVLLHALVCTGYLSWHAVLADLARTHRVVVFDQRWHGRGIRSRRFRLEDCADDVAALMDVLGIETAIPVGYSMGGAVAQLVWRRHPDRVDGLVLCSTSRNGRGARHERLFMPVANVAMLGLSPYSAKRVERLASTLPPLPPTESGGLAWRLAEFRSTSAWSAPAVVAAIGAFNSKPWIGQVDVPTAVVVTTKDRTIPARRQYKLAASIPGAEVFPVEAGHSAIVLAASKWNVALHAAVESVTARVEAGDRDHERGVSRRSR